MNKNNYNYDAIKYFLSVASHKNLSRAAYSLGISQSALSQSMKNLEQSLNIKLFQRNTRGIILTREGAKFYEIAKIGDNYFRNAIADTLRFNKSMPLTTFKISSSNSLLNAYIFPIIKKMTLKYKDVNFEIINYVKESEIVKEIQNQNIDLILEKTNEKFLIKEIVSQKIAEHNYCFIYDGNHFNFPDEVDKKDLEDYLIIIKERTGKNDNLWIRSTFKRLIICKSDDNIYSLVKNGVGIGIYPKELAIKSGLKILNLKDYIPPKRTVEAYYLENNKIAKEFVNEILANFK